MRLLDIYSSATVCATSVHSGYCHFLLCRGPDGLGSDILRQGTHAISAALFLFKEAFVPSFREGFWII